MVSHRATALPVQSTGHADLVEAVDGSWWVVLLATRPRGMSPLFHVLGRETFLAPVDWVDGWPRVEPIGLTVDRRPPGPVGEAVRASRDDFDGAVLGPSWLAVRRPASTFCDLTRRPGWLSLDGSGPLDDPTPAFVGQRQRFERTRASALVDAGDATEAGLAVRMDDRFHYEVAICGGRMIARGQAGPFTTVFGEAPKPAGDVVLVVSTRPSAGDGPDDVVLGYRDENGTDHDLAVVDGRFVSTEVAGGMLGRVIGVYATDGTAAVDWFELVEDEG